MRTFRKSLRFVGIALGVGLAGSAFFFVACKSDDRPPLEGATDSGFNDHQYVYAEASSKVDASDAGVDASVDAAPTICPVYTGSNAACKALTAHCNACSASIAQCAAEDLQNCDTTTGTGTSASYQQAIVGCTVDGGSCGTDFSACVLGALENGSPSTAQSQVASDYCATCTPSLTGAACQTAFFSPDASNYLPAAVLPAPDSVASQIDSKCTGSALDAGTSCSLAFVTCAVTISEANTPASNCDSSGNN